MRFAKPICPECGELLRGTIELIRGCAEIFAPDDIPPNADCAQIEFEYSGQTDVWWDEQRTDETDDHDEVYVICNRGHVWTTKLDVGEGTGMK